MEIADEKIVVFGGYVIDDDFAVQFVFPVEMQDAESHIFVLVVALQEDVVELLGNLFFKNVYFLSCEESLVDIA